jgi:hypothetical protein
MPLKIQIPTSTLKSVSIPTALAIAIAAGAPSCSDDDTSSSTRGSSSASSASSSTSGSGGSGEGGAGGGAGSGGEAGVGGGTGGGAACVPKPNLDLLSEGLTTPSRADYTGGGDGGLAHITYWTIQANTLPDPEKYKASQMQANVIHSQKLIPTADVAGTEILGTLSVMGPDGERKQQIVLKVPAAWNGSIVVAGTPGTRGELASEGAIAPWLLSRGYAYISGNKGMTNGGADGNTTLLNKQHPTQHWGMMMIDLALFAKERLEKSIGADPACPVTVKNIYAVGLSNGGYQVRRALEIDHARVAAGEARLFAGGIDWAGMYMPDARALDVDNNGTVTTAEYAAKDTLVSTNDDAALAMGYAYDPATQTSPEHFMETPPFMAAHPAMTAAGFDPSSAPIWGAYNSAFDSFKAAVPAFKGTGYYNIVAYYFRADLLGHDAAQSQAYSPFAGAMDPPPFYTWPGRGVDKGFTDESVTWALKAANTAEFSSPLITVHGDRDGLLGIDANAKAYSAAVEANGKPELYRLYVIQNGGHIDLHSDGAALDFDFDGMPGEEGVADVFTLVQPYAERAFDHLVAWAEQGTAAPPSKTITTDPKNDILDASAINF